jgi:hypothetical protein
MTTTRYTISDIKAANKAAGRFFFERDTMRFFNSRVFRSVYQGPGGVYFVTSEQFTGSDGVKAPRTYKVREFDPETGNVSTFGRETFARLDDARSVASTAAKTPYDSE